jgi:hypothetical protein
MLIFARIVKKYPFFYGILRFIKVFTRARHWSPSRTTSIKWNFRFSRRRIWSSESSGIYCLVVKSMSETSVEIDISQKTLNFTFNQDYTLTRCFLKNKMSVGVNCKKTESKDCVLHLQVRHQFILSVPVSSVCPTSLSKRMKVKSVSRTHVFHAPHHLTHGRLITLFPTLYLSIHNILFRLVIYFSMLIAWSRCSYNNFIDFNSI